jgi:hypothetical protein
LESVKRNLLFAKSNCLLAKSNWNRPKEIYFAQKQISFGKSQMASALRISLLIKASWLFAKDDINSEASCLLPVTAKPALILSCL